MVVATGTFGRTPNVPAFARDLDPSILQLHSSEYRRPDQLAPGRVLVVGASHSGCDIAYEAAEHRPTTLAGRDCGQIPVRWGSRALRYTFPVLRFLWLHVLTRRTPIGRKEMAEIRHHGGPMLRVKRDDLQRRGVERVTNRVTGVSDGRPVLDDGRVVDASTVVWCTGFRQVFDWIDFPIFGEDGFPARVPRCRRLGARTVLLRALPSSTRSARWSSSGSAATPSTSPAGSTRGSVAPSQVAAAA